MNQNLRFPLREKRLLLQLVLACLMVLVAVCPGAAQDRSTILKTISAVKEAAGAARGRIETWRERALKAEKQAREISRPPAAAKELVNRSYRRLLLKVAQARLSETERTELLHEALRNWMDCTLDPRGLRLQLGRKPLGALRPALTRAGRPLRLKLLASMTARAAGLPGWSDLDVLVEAASWSLELQPKALNAQERLDWLSRDLLTLFTDRAPDGLRRAAQHRYAAGRFKDRGFAPGLADGSDQVRHFSWAFRMFAKSRDADATEGQLALKEKFDAMRRRTALNRKDLALNRCARLLVKAMKGQSSATPQQLIRSWPALLRRILKRGPGKPGGDGRF